MKRVDPDMRLDGFRLSDALESIYATIASTLRGHGATDGPDLYCKEIPGLVFSAAVGAGWLPLAEADFDSKIGTSKGDVVWQADFRLTAKTELPEWVRKHIDSVAKLTPEQRKERALPEHPPRPTEFSKNQLKWIVQFDDFYVERTFLESFLDVLKEVISLHMGTGTLHEERLKSLPAHTSVTQRRALLRKYVSERQTRGLKTTMKQLAEWATVDYSDLTKWKNGSFRVPDSSDKAQRISLLLRFDERNRARAYRRAIVK
jgi:hypothetical protein